MQQLNEEMTPLLLYQKQPFSASTDSSSLSSSNALSQSQSQAYSYSDEESNERHQIPRSEYSLAYSTHNQRAFDFLISGFISLVLLIWILSSFISVRSQTPTVITPGSEWDARGISGLRINGNFNLRIMQSSGNEKTARFAVKFHQRRKSFLALPSLSQSATSLKILIDPSDHTVIIITPIYASAWRPVAFDILPDLDITMPHELSLFQVHAKSANLIYSGPNINTTISVSVTNAGVIHFITPISASETVSLSTNKGFIFINDISASEISLRVTKSGTIEAKKLSEYFNLSTFIQSGTVSMVVNPSKDLHLPPPKHKIESQSGDVGILCFGFQGRFKVTSQSGKIYLAGNDWPLESTEPAIGTVGGKGVERGVFDVLSFGNSLVSLEFQRIALLMLILTFKSTLISSGFYFYMFAMQ
ncbi:hypothetical protein HK100_005850 [Physocladia obscura]|uniref:Adhesin domain-containing protein n=1 Tax=Physocladia obscura TaxID=109957 RepID=A0AAD5X937_9FUNG|nr:hypothetical protein HK100_005850 [Physocladia obscura]